MGHMIPDFEVSTADPRLRCTVGPDSVAWRAFTETFPSSRLPWDTRWSIWLAGASCVSVRIELLLPAVESVDIEAAILHLGSRTPPAPVGGADPCECSVGYWDSPLAGVTVLWGSPPSIGHHSVEAMRGGHSGEVSIDCGAQERRLPWLKKR